MALLLLLFDQRVASMQVFLDKRVFELGHAFFQFPLDVGIIRSHLGG